MHSSLALASLLIATTAAAAPTTWMSPDAAPWRVPVALANDIAIADAQRAVVITDSELMSVDRKTGAVSAPVKVVTDGTFERVVKVDGRILAFGRRGDRAAIWELSVSPPSAKPLKIDDLGGESATKSPALVRLSPGGTKLAICTRTRSPVIRDARTLRVLQVAKGRDCIRIRWSDDDHVAIGRSTEGKVIEVATGKLVTDDEPKHIAGPRGMRIAATGKSADISKAGSVLRTVDRDLEFADVVWSPDGAHALATDHSGELVILEARAKGRDRTVAVPPGRLRLAVDDREALVLGDHAILAIDLATGAVRQGTDTVSAIRQVATANGSVLVVSDALRVWRDGKIVRRGPASSAVAPGEPIAMLGDEHLTWWSADDTRQEVGPVGSWSLLSRAGSSVLYGDARRAFAATGTGAPAPWLSADHDHEIITLDAKHGRAAIRAPKTFEIGTPAKRWAVQIPGYDETCGSTGRVGFSPDGKHFVIGGAGALYLFDGTARKRLGRIELDSLTYGAWEFLPTGELLLAGVDEVVIVDLATRRAVGWKPPHGDLPVALGVDADELAIGYHDGRILWASLAEVRKAAASRAVRIVPPKACTR